jgi:regulatory protein
VKSALRLLKARARSRQEILSALKRKGVPADILQTVLERLAGWGYLDDSRFAKDRALALLREGRLGGAGVLRKLEQHGIPESLARSAISAAETELGSDPKQSARAALAKRGLAGPLDGPKRARAFRLLASRGFAEGVIESLLGDPALDPPAKDE